MILSELSAADVASRLAGPGLRLRTGPVVTCIRSHMPLVAQGLSLHYGEHTVVDQGVFADFSVNVFPPPGLRRWVKKQVLFQSDEGKPFAPLPAAQAFPMLEWGMNWCISTHLHQFLIIHAAVVERHGRALIMPAPPGSGKSTLCAGLISRGWRLLSDELTLIDIKSGLVHPVPRPVSLKNASIDVIRAFAPDAVFGPPVKDTLKGTVAHMKPSVESVRRSNDRVAPGWILLPRYVAGQSTTMTAMPKAKAFMELADNAFNYHIHGKNGFETVARVIESCSCFEFSYSDLNDAEATLTRMAMAPTDE